LTIEKKPRRRASPARTTLSIRLTREERLRLEKASRLHNLSQGRYLYLARLAVEHTRQDLLAYAVRRYRAQEASVSELATETGLDVPSILHALASEASAGESAAHALLAEAQALSRRLADPELHELAKAALDPSSP
jgi:hypothetical protein